MNEKYGEKKSEWAKEIEYFEVFNGALYQREISTKNRKRNEMNIQLVLPLSLRSIVLKKLHDSPMGGHLAFLRTYFKVKKNYF